MSRPGLPPEIINLPFEDGPWRTAMRLRGFPDAGRDGYPAAVAVLG
jgi:hypothetical protein